MATLDKIVPQAPQPDVEPDPSINPEAAIDVPDDYERTASTAEPAADVGGEIGRKPGLNAWQIAGFIAGGIAVAAGIAAVVYTRSRQAHPEAQLAKAQLENAGHKAGLKRLDFDKPALGYVGPLREGLERSRQQFDKAPIVRSLRDKVSALLH